ncbi:hypothetical protein AB204_06740 [Xenorhabdus khoisanae]|uniref:Uncharacterized protein n=1 Tax=Xenorhabdus khoisanae TaxID=880157 RepID=A0A0J5FUF2_9GAMM|nr:hypothetical protein AB204_06740 [Xenorhabdus khoisanae]
MKFNSRKDSSDLPALFFLRAAQSLSLVAVVVANQFPHSQFNVTELVLLALVLLLDGASVIAVGDQHQTALHDFNRQCAANIKAGRLKPLPFQVDGRRTGE